MLKVVITALVILLFPLTVHAEDVLKGHVEMTQGRHFVLIDDLPRTIGGELDLSTDPNKILPAQKFPFVATGDSEGAAFLLIGHIDGVDYPNTSPTIIKVNGVIVYYVIHNEVNLKVSVPLSVLSPSGYNQIQIQAGYKIKPDVGLVYDLVTFQDMSLEF